MHAVISLQDREYQVDSGQTLFQALYILGIEPESVLAIRDGEMMDSSEKINPHDEIRLVYVITGGVD